MRRSSKLAVILHADVVGSTTLVQLDEDLAHERIQDTFRRFGDTITKYQGRVRELRGDALLAEFERASDAVTASLAFQAEQVELIAQLNDTILPMVRVGNAMGEVIVADNTVTGAGVVLAQRVEQLAEPGGVCITGAIHEALPTRMPFDQEDLGEQELKGFDERVRIYRVELKAGESIPPPQESGQDEASSKRRRLIAFVAAIAVVVAGGAAYWFKPWEQREETASVERMAFPLPDKPSIAVLPFNNMSDDRSQEYFSDGITEDIITDLSKISGLFVIARNSTFQYKRMPVDIKGVARELGVRYILEGSVRKARDQVRINAQLIDATTGGHVWADRYDGRVDNIFELQDKVTRRIIAALSVQLTAGEREEVTRQETGSTDAYDAFLRGWEHYLRQTPQDFAKAVAHFNRALELDRAYGRAYAALAATYWEVWKRFWHQDLGLPLAQHEPRYRAEQFLVEAMENPTPLAHQVASAMLLHQQQYEDAIAEARRAIALDSNDADSYIALAAALTLSGGADEALEWIERAMRLNPHYPGYYLYQLGLAQFNRGTFDEAAISLEKATAINPDDRWSQRLLIATYGSLDRNEDAARVLEAVEQRGSRGWLNAIDPLTVTSSAFWLPFKEPEDAERLAQGLRKAGVPD